MRSSTGYGDGEHFVCFPVDYDVLTATRLQMMFNMGNVFTAIDSLARHEQRDHRLIAGQWRRAIAILRPAFMVASEGQATHEIRASQRRTDTIPGHSDRDAESTLSVHRSPTSPGDEPSRRSTVDECAGPSLLQRVPHTSTDSAIAVVRAALRIPPIAQLGQSGAINMQEFVENVEEVV